MTPTSRAKVKGSKKNYQDPKNIPTRIKKNIVGIQKIRGRQSFLGLGARVGRGFRARVEDEEEELERE